MDKKVYITCHSHSLKRIIWPNFIYFRSFLLPVKASILCLFWFVIRCQQLEDGVFISMRDGSSVFTLITAALRLDKDHSLHQIAQTNLGLKCSAEVGLEGSEGRGWQIVNCTVCISLLRKSFVKRGTARGAFLFLPCFYLLCLLFFSNINCLFLRLLTLLSL